MKEPADLTKPGGRLRAERERLTLSQANAAAIAGVTKDHLSRWEASKGSDTCEALTALARIGLDVMFVVTGQTTPETLAGVTALEALGIMPPDKRHRFILRMLEEELRK